MSYEFIGDTCLELAGRLLPFSTIPLQGRQRRQPEEREGQAQGSAQQLIFYQPQGVFPQQPRGRSREACGSGCKGGMASVG
jgi:hypothetical protein